MTGDLVIRGGSAADGASCDVTIAAGRIASPAAAAPGAGVLDATGLTVLPGWLDLQVNGVAGIDLTLEPERLWEAAAALATYGVTAFLPTVITSAPQARERALAALRDGPPAGWAGAMPLGLHFEGPMIAEERKGAHPARWLRAPAPEIVDGWRRQAGVAMVTIAPELPGALEVISALVAAGVVVSIGHTTAGSDLVLAALDRGARMVTHLGNAMPPVLARDPGPAGVALGDARVTAGVIADGHHLHRASLAAYASALGPERLLAVTDCTAALGLPDGPARLGDQHVVVAGGTVRLADGTLAGSGAALAQCLRELRAATGWSLSDVAATCTRTAADLIDDRARGRLEVGARGDVTLVDEKLDVVATVVGGRVVHHTDGGMG
ncbi:N-acetylglucosamine 6-phosphate deacetylase [Nocardioides sp. GY 10113]|uniref:N-acetylglucosamine-6-phosphate deacetylase n=1 Tax=Nocardioides sp. GY 10113 TaxID=2569761 RepID=UPI0010A9172C|nr:N-acetylglucosamine 6-phosphate deacetylase [Nocardioides sp. GY 10113]TIC85805.1 N-acetylglucosamine 6-phosphate deacetylase [Nocardioides sp. GY 10113]